MKILRMCLIFGQLDYKTISVGGLKSGADIENKRRRTVEQ